MWNNQLGSEAQTNSNPNFLIPVDVYQEALREGHGAKHLMIKQNQQEVWPCQ